MIVQLQFDKNPIGGKRIVWYQPFIRVIAGNRKALDEGFTK